MILPDQTNKRPASVSIREILGTPTVFVILSSSDPASALALPIHNPRDHYDTLILTTTLFLTSTAADTPIAPLPPPHFAVSIVTSFSSFLTEITRNNGTPSTKKVWQGRVHLHSPYL